MQNVLKRLSQVEGVQAKTTNLSALGHGGSFSVRLQAPSKMLVLGRNSGNLL